MNYNKNLKIWLLFVLGGLLAACSDNFLDKKPDKALLVPSSLADYQAILDNIDVMNMAPGLVQVSADDFYTSSEGLQGLSILEQNAYRWKKDLYAGTTYVGDWNVPYQQVFTANVVLDGISTLNILPSQQQDFERIRASALFFRALAFYELAQVFAAPYDPATAGQLAGIPIRLSADVTKVSQSMSLAKSYDQIISDLIEAAAVLPALSAYRNRPCAAAAYGLLARVYLQSQQYALALKAANQCLALSPALLDYNTLDSAAAVPFPLALPAANPEVLYYECLVSYDFLSSALTGVDTSLLAAYQPGDLRRPLFFLPGPDGYVNFRGTYSGSIRQGSSSGIFSGVATDEVYLIKAECLARTGEASQAIQTLNTLLEKRWKKGDFVPLSAGNAQQVLAVVLMERRKELVGRGLRWADLRRLNQEPAFSRTLQRILDNQTLELVSGDARYVLPVPPAERNPAQQ